MIDATIEIVVFDCDSTLTTIEGIDTLANRAGVENESRLLTNAAMAGELSLAEAYAKRMELVKPSKADIYWLGKEYINNQTTDSHSIVSLLQKLDKEVHIVSGGLMPAVMMLAETLSVPVKNVHAVDIYFTESQEYAGFDNNSPLTSNGGKGLIGRKLKEYDKKIIMVGDGITDLEMQSIGIKVIGYGGVVSREIVKEKADIFVEDKSLLAVLDFILTEEERQCLRR